ncbi:hypothetical protein V502_00433 [Pseudogymnoascus sp. VKM F-4520 (FW-2644)]|nr:hypothetical protein V502_00433 [Pseudogymnoascus sp. VKM F-4520 (FW-2644)]
MEGQSDVERIIRYHFTNPQLLVEAFEAAGVSELNKGVTGQRHGNKRLALVGDALIRLAILDRWFPSGASTEEGNNLVSDLASNNALKDVVERGDMVKFVVKNPSQKGGPQRTTLASTTEAIVGAVCEAIYLLGITQDALHQRPKSTRRFMSSSVAISDIDTLDRILDDKRELEGKLNSKISEVLAKDRSVGDDTICQGYALWSSQNMVVAAGLEYSQAKSAILSHGKLSSRGVVARRGSDRRRLSLSSSSAVGDGWADTPTPVGAQPGHHSFSDHITTNTLMVVTYNHEARFRSQNENMESNERTPLITIARIAPPRQRYQNIVTRQFFAFAFGSTLILVVLFVLLRRRPVVDTQICHSSLGTSKAYASAKALNNNIADFCQDVTNNEPVVTIGWTWSKIYYRNTPEEYTMTVAISNRAFSSYDNQCIDAMRSIINGCDVPVDGCNPMNWKQGGKRLHGGYTYQIDIFRQNRPWPPPTQPRQACEGWYKIIWQHYDLNICAANGTN